MRQRTHHLLTLLVAAAVAVGVAAADAQVIDPVVPSTTTTTTQAGSTTTTTAPPPSVSTPTTAGPTSTTTTTTAPSDSSDPNDPSRPTDPSDPNAPVLDDTNSTPAPDGSSTGDDGDGTSAPPPGRRIGIPAEAQRIMDSVARTPSSNSRDLDAAMSQLVALGLTVDEAYRVGFGRFIIAGPANYTHDWLFPRYGPGFRFHLGTDVFAPFGTPVRAPVDGVAQASNNSLGGLAAKVYMADGTYFYMAHLSAVPESMQEGQAIEVKTGDIVGFVGTSGNAAGTPPHVHLGIYPQGGAAIDPKPVLDRFLNDARTRFPDVINFYRQEAGLPVPVNPISMTSAEATPVRTNRGLLSTALLRPLTSPVAPDGIISTDVLFTSTANPSGGAVQLAEAEAHDAAMSIDWQERQFLEEVRLDVLSRGESILRLTLEPFVDPASSDAIARGAVRGG